MTFRQQHTRRAVSQNEGGAHVRPAMVMKEPHQGRGKPLGADMARPASQDRPSIGWSLSLLNGDTSIGVAG